MTQPEAYERQYNFEDYQTANPTDPLPGDQVDQEFNAVKFTLDEILTNLAVLQADDGYLNAAAIRAGTIGVAHLSSALQEALSGVEVSFVAPYFVSTSTAPNVSEVGNGMYRISDTSLGFAVGSTIAAKMNGVASAVNYPTLTNAVSGAGPIFGVDGTNTNIAARYFSKGTGTHDFFTDAGAAQQYGIGRIASATSYIRAYGASSGVPTFRGEGSVSDVGIAFVTKGTFGVSFYTGSTSNQQIGIDHVASAVNVMHLIGAAVGNPIEIYASGNDTNIPIKLTPKGASLVFAPGVEITGTNAPADCGLYRSSANNMRLVAAGATQVRISGIASTNDWIVLQGGVNGSSVPAISVQTGATNAGLYFSTAGTSEYLFYHGSFARVCLALRNTASSVNNLSITPGATGVGPTLSAEGETNVPLRLAPNGSGVVQFANSTSFSANAAIATVLGSVGPTGSHTTVQKWLKITDNAGTALYIPCF